MDNDRFEKLVADGIDALPEHVLKRMQNVAVLIEDEMSLEDRREGGYGDEDVVFGLYVGVPLAERGVDYAELPDRILIYKKPILEAYTDEEDIKACVENTVWHEVAHHFGFGEEWVEREEERRGKTL